MPNRPQFIRYDDTDASAYAGAAGEVIVNLTKGGLHVFDGVIGAGGHYIAPLSEIQPLIDALGVTIANDIAPINTELAAATTNITANTLVLRDNNSQFKVGLPTDPNHVARKSDVDLKANKAGDIFAGLVTINTNGVGFSLRGIAVGNNNFTYQSWLDSNGTRQGYFGKAAIGDANIYLVNEQLGGSISFITNGTVIANGYVIWTAGNDGAGSGLDADLLDGLESSYFTNIIARLGYTPINKAGDGVNGRLSFVYAGADGPNGWNDVIRFSTGSHAAIWNVSVNTLLGMHNDRGLYYMDLATGGTFVVRPSTGVMTFNGYTIWHSGNDGAGTGLDADFLDGHDSSYFTAIVARLGYTPLNANGGTSTGLYMSGALIFNNQAAPYSWGFYFGDGSGWYLPFRRASDSAIVALMRDNGQLYYGNGAGLYWHSLNDGAGSGLDADYVDGWDRDTIRNWNNLLNYPGDTGTGLLVHANGGYINEIYNVGWFRSQGAVGWYSETYGGGLYMADTTWLQAYGGKSFYTTAGYRGSSYTWLSGNPLIKKFVAGPYSLVFGTVYGVAHGLGGYPDAVHWKLYCVSPEHGFNIGDEIDMATLRATDGASIAPGVSVWMNTTTVNMNVGSVGLYVRKSDGTLGLLTAANWNVYVVATILYTS